MSSSICSTILICVGGTACSHGLLRVRPICIHILPVAVIACIAQLFLAFWLPTFLSDKRQVLLKLCRSNDFEPLCDAVDFLLFKLADTLFFVHSRARLLCHRHALRLRFNDEVRDAIVVKPIIVVADPAVIQVVELVIILNILLISGVRRFRLLTKLLTRLNFCFRLSRHITSGFLGLALGFLAVIGAALMPAILLDGSKGAVELESGEHGFYQVFKTVAASDPTGLRLLVLGSANVLLVCVICGLCCTCWNSGCTCGIFGGTGIFDALGDFLATFLGGHLVGLGLSCLFCFLSELIGLYQKKQTIDSALLFSVTKSVKSFLSDCSCLY